MVISVASGKGGTGKTLVSVSLALSIEDEHVLLLDCDVEEPNTHIFIKAGFDLLKTVNVPVPRVNEALCVHCKKCAEFCKYKAILASKTTVTIFPDLCHGCGGCAIVCPVHAIDEEMHRIGRLMHGSTANIEVIYGELEISKPLAVPIIREVKRQISNDSLVIVDSPPGTSCPVIEAVKGSDFCVLVTEPTPFGFHDLTMMVEVLTQINIPFGVVINRADLGDERVWDFCKSKNIPILLTVPYERRIAVSYSKGVPMVVDMPEWKEKFKDLYKEIKRLLNK